MMVRGLVRLCDFFMLLVQRAYELEWPAFLFRRLQERHLVMDRAPVTLLQRTALRHFWKLGYLDSSDPLLQVWYNAWYPERLPWQ